jgi:hypothetical protein
VDGADGGGAETEGQRTAGIGRRARGGGWRAVWWPAFEAIHYSFLKFCYSLACDPLVLPACAAVFDSGGQGPGLFFQPCSHWKLWIVPPLVTWWCLFLVVFSMVVSFGGGVLAHRSKCSYYTK